MKLICLICKIIKDNSEALQNFASVFWFFISICGLAFGLWLTLQGRLTQSLSHLHERFENATIMLGNDSEAVQAGGVRALENMIKQSRNDTIVDQSVHVLETYWKE